MGDTNRIFALSAQGKLTDTERFLDNPSEFNTDGFSQNDIAGVKSSTDGSLVYAVNNRTDSRTSMKGSLAVLDVKTNKLTKRIELPGFPGFCQLAPEPQARFLRQQQKFRWNCGKLC